MAGSASITGRQHYVLGIGHPVTEAETEAPTAIYALDESGNVTGLVGPDGVSISLNALDEEGPSSDLLLISKDVVPYSDTSGWSGHTGSGSDGDGAFVNMTNADVNVGTWAAKPGQKFAFRVKTAGTLPNTVKLRYLTAADAQVSIGFSYIFTSGTYDEPVADAAVDLSQSFMVPNNQTIAKVQLIFAPEANHAVTACRLYGIAVGNDDTLPLLPRFKTPLPYRGCAVQNIYSQQNWLAAPEIGYAEIYTHLSFLKTNLGLRDGDAIRLFMNSDSAIIRRGNVPSEFSTAVWSKIDAVAAAFDALNLKWVPVLFYPFPFTSATQSFQRIAMTDADVASAYKDRAQELASYLDRIECVPALDLINEYGWSLSFTPGGGASYTPQQIAACYENVSAGARLGTRKPLLASCATGKDCVAVLAFQNPSSFDILSYHSYNGAFDFYRPHMGKPLVAGEFGPDVFETDPTTILNQTLPVMRALPLKASAAWMWSDYTFTQPTISVPGSVKNAPLVAAFKDFLPNGNWQSKSLPRRMAQLDDVEQSRAAAHGAVPIFNGALGKFVFGDPNVNTVTAGQSTLRREDAASNSGSALTLTNGRISLTYFTASKSEVVTVARVIVGTASAGASLAKMGLYSVADDGTLTLVASTANDTAMFGGIGRPTRSFSASATVTAGQRYAFAAIVVGASTQPILGGTNVAGFNADEAAVAPRLSAYVTGQTDLPASIDVGSLSASAGMHYAVIA